MDLAASVEKVSREIRRGGRTFVVAVLDIPELPGGSLMIVGPHLENRGKPHFRRMQMREVLNYVQDLEIPVVVGDMNTLRLTPSPPASNVRSIAGWAVPLSGKIRP